MAAIEMPAADERIAVFEIKELPGRASIIDSALVLGSGCCEGTFDWYRTDIEAAGMETLDRAEARRRPAPTKRVSGHYSMKEADHGITIPARDFINRIDMVESENNSEMLLGIQVRARYKPSSVAVPRYPPACEPIPPAHQFVAATMKTSNDFS
jgi:hypothetical protein